jgi:hypothetical protein
MVHQPRQTLSQVAAPEPSSRRGEVGAAAKLAKGQGESLDPWEPADAVVAPAVTRWLSQ